MYGKLRERPNAKGKYEIRLWWNGKREEFRHNKRGEPLDSPGMGQRAHIQISQEIEDHVFDPTEWKKDKPFILDNAFDAFNEAKQCGLEWQYNRQGLYKKHISKELGQLDIREIRTLHLNKLHGSLIKNGLSEKTIENILGVLHSVFKMHRIPDPGFPKIIVPEKEIEWLTSEEQEIVMGYLEEKDLPIFRFLEITGCRSSEACSLMREDVDWKNGMVIIRRSMGLRGRIIPYTKNRRMNKIPIAIFGQWTQILRPLEATPFIFSRQGRPYHRQRLEQSWSPANEIAQREHGIKIIHVKNAFRHSMASQLINDGVPLEAVSKMLGHSDTRITQKIYAHIKPETAWAFRGKLLMGKNWGSGDKKTNDFKE